MKKFVRPFAIIGATAAIVLTASTGVRAVEYPDGDANCSGTVTPLDSITIIRSILEIPGWEIGDCGAKVDLNCSGSITPVDAYLASRIMRGYSIPSC